MQKFAFAAIDDALCSALDLIPGVIMAMKPRLSFVIAALLAAPLAWSNPTSFTEAAAQPGSRPAPVTVTPRAPTGTVTVFTDRAAFNVAFPGLAVETFNGGNAAPGNFSVCDAPLTSVTGDATCAFSPNELVPGITYQDNPGPDLASLILLGDGTSLNPTQAMVANTFDDAFDLVLTTPVNAIGMDLISTPAPGSGGPDTIAVSIFDASDTLIDTIPAANASGPGVFFGVSSPVPIRRISLLSTTNQAEGVDNVAFAASAGPTNTTPVPAIGTTGVIALVLGMLALVGFAWHRRH